MVQLISSPIYDLPLYVAQHHRALSADRRETGRNNAPTAFLVACTPTLTCSGVDFSHLACLSTCLFKQIIVSNHISISVQVVSWLSFSSLFGVFFFFQTCRQNPHGKVFKASLLGYPFRETLEGVFSFLLCCSRFFIKATCSAVGSAPVRCKGKRLTRLSWPCHSHNCSLHRGCTTAVV